MRRFESLLLLLACVDWGAAPAAPTGKPILTPKPGPAPEIHCPKVYGVRPGRPFLCRIPVHRPTAHPVLRERTARGAGTGCRESIIRGHTPAQPGDYPLTIQASKALGYSTRTLRIAVGDSIALTPPMGWNDWYTHYDWITDKLMRQAADAMIASGIADFGYQYMVGIINLASDRRRAAVTWAELGLRPAAGTPVAAEGSGGHERIRAHIDRDGVTLVRVFPVA